MEFHLITAVWGDWHTRMFLSVTLPSLLAEGNLPALAAAGRVRYAIWSNPEGLRRLEAHPLVTRLRETIHETDLRAATDEPDPAPIHHIQWWRLALDNARRANAIFVTSPPDVVWSRNSFTGFRHAFETGKAGVMVPSIRVVSETLVPELRAARRDDGVLDLPGPALMRAGARHLHPLTLASMPDLGAGRIGSEMTWPVDDGGLVMRQAMRPMIAHDTARVRTSDYQFSKAFERLDEVAMMTDVDDMLMLSLAPLFKDISLLEPHRPLTPLDIARWSSHEMVDTPINDEMAATDIDLHLGDRHGDGWAETRGRAAAFGADVRHQRNAVRIIGTLREHGCAAAAGVLALAMHETAPFSGLDCGGAWTVLAPSDVALARHGRLERLHDACLPGSEATLNALIHRHLIPGRALNPMAMTVPVTVAAHDGTAITLHPDGTAETPAGSAFAVRAIELGQRRSILAIDGLIETAA